MENKQKQIEKLQSILPNMEVIRCMYGDTDFAKYLYDHSCRKIEDDSIVITKVEKEKLLHEMYEQGRFDAIADLEKDGKMVLLKEEYEKLKSENKRLFYQNANLILENNKFKNFMQQNDWESIEQMETTLDKCGEVLYKKLQREYKKGYKQGREKAKNDIFKKLFESNGNTRADIWYLDLVEIAKQFGFNKEN